MNCRSGLKSVSRSTGLPSLTGTLSYSRDWFAELTRIWQNTSHSKTINISLISQNTRPNAFIMWENRHHYGNAIRASGQQSLWIKSSVCVSHERMRALPSLHRTSTRGLDTLDTHWITQRRQTHSYRLTAPVTHNPLINTPRFTHWLQLISESSQRSSESTGSPWNVKVFPLLIIVIHSNSVLTNQLALLTFTSRDENERTFSKKSIKVKGIFK